MSIAKYLLWALYWALTSGDRARHSIAQSMGRRVFKGPTGWTGGNTFIDRSRPPQKRTFLTFAEFKALHGSQAKEQ